MQPRYEDESYGPQEAYDEAKMLQLLAQGDASGKKVSNVEVYEVTPNEYKRREELYTNGGSKRRTKRRK